MKIAVIGVGAVGGYFGGKLAQSGKEVSFIARGHTLNILQRDGLRVDSTRGDFSLRSLPATDNPDDIGPVDAVLLGVKAWQVPTAAASLRPLIGPETCIVPLQNGVEAAGQLASVLGEQSVIGGTCGIFCYQVAPGHLNQSGPEPFVRFAELDNKSSARTERLRQAFADAEVKVDIPADIHVAIWQKFIMVAPLSSVGSVTGVPVGVWRSVDSTHSLAADCAREIQALGQARGIALADDAAAKVTALYADLPPRTTASMQRDVAEGRPSELEAQVGAVVRMGRESGVPTPVHDFLYAALQPRERLARGEIKRPG